MYNSSPEPRSPYEFHQIDKIRQDCACCQSCRNPRHSLNSRKRWAAKEAAILTRLLDIKSISHHVYFGTVRLGKKYTCEEHKKIRSRFLKNLRQLPGNVQIRCVMEVGDNLRPHYHYAMYSEQAITTDQIKTCWEIKTNICHKPATSIRAGSKYIYNDLKQPKYIRLLQGRNVSPGITFNTRNFYNQSKKEVWRDQLKEWHGENYIDPKTYKEQKRKERYNPDGSRKPRFIKPETKKKTYKTQPRTYLKSYPINNFCPYCNPERELPQQNCRDP